MLDCVEELRSARGLAWRVVPYLSHGTFASLRIWLRGLATNIICSFGARPPESSVAALFAALARTGRFPQLAHPRGA